MVFACFTNQIHIAAEKEIFSNSQSLRAKPHLKLWGISETALKAPRFHQMPSVSTLQLQLYQLTCM